MNNVSIRARHLRALLTAAVLTGMFWASAAPARPAITLGAASTPSAVQLAAPASKVSLQGPTEPMPVGTYPTITASEPGEDEFAFKVISGNATLAGRQPLSCQVTAAQPGESVVEAADAHGNIAKITVTFFDVPN